MLEHPLEIASTDLFEWNGRQHFITVDHYSNFVEVDKLESTDSKPVIKAHMSRYGECDVLINDNF